MSGKSDKIQSHKKKTEKKCGESRKYAEIPYDSVITTAETQGISGLNEEVAKQLAEDVSYRLREVIHNCCVHLRQNKRRRLTTCDVNSVFETADVPQIYGHVRAEEHLNLVYVKDANVFVPDEVEVHLPALALSHSLLVQSGEPFVRGAWLNPDVSTDVSGNVTAVKHEDVKPATSSSEKPSSSSSDYPPPHLVTYYTNISKIIMGNSEKLLKTVLKDLQSNSKIGPIVIYLINLLTLGLSKFTKGGPGAVLRHRFLRTVEALTFNSFIEPSAYMSVHQLILVILKCVLDPVLIEGLSPKCNYELRDYAAQVLAKVVNSWCGSDQKLQMEIQQKLYAALLDESSSLRVHYTALRTLCAMGQEAFDHCLWPNLPQYFIFLEKTRRKIMMKSSEPSSKMSWCHQNADVVAVEGALLDVAEMTYKCWDSLQGQTIPSSIKRIEYLLEEYFGDTLIPRRPYHPVVTAKRESCVTTNISNGTTMEVDMLMKETSTSDFDLDYRNWTAIAKIPNHVPPLFLSNGRCGPSSLPDRVLEDDSIIISSAFELQEMHEQYRSTIHFNFAGANPVSKRRLKQRTLDPKHARLVCPSIYFIKSCQLGCMGKAVRKQHKSSVSRSCMTNIMEVL